MSSLNQNDYLPQSDAEVASRDHLLALTAQIVSSHLTKTKLPADDVPQFIKAIHTTLKELSAKDGAQTQQIPALPVDQSVTPDFIFCLEDGKKFRMLKKHLRASYDMSPEQYRAKWGLSVDYPMVAPNYATKRQELAKQSGLGRKRK